jgi:hypothetical protein
MKVKSVKSLYLNKEDIKEAVILLLAERCEFELAAHLKSSKFEIDFATDGDLILDLDGLFMEKEIERL